MNPVSPAAPAASGRLLTLAAPPLAEAQGWRLGQILIAAVRAVEAPGRFELQIGHHRVRAESRLPLEPGQTLRLVVRETGARPVLQLAEPVGPEAVLRQALRRVLPRQQPLGTTLAGLARAAAPGGPLPAELAVPARRLVDTLARPDQLTRPGELRRAMEDSGVFLEARLAATPPGRPPPVASDLKALLLSLLAAAGPAAGPRPVQPGPAFPPPLPGGAPQPQPTVAPPALPEEPAAAAADLAGRLEGAVARIQLNQLASLPRGEDPWPVLSLELPLRQDGDIHIVDLRIHGEGRAQSGEAPTAWSVWLALAPPGLGPLRVQVSLHGERVSVTFWAERRAAAGALAARLGELEGRLAAAGLSPGRLDSASGRPEAPAPAPPRLVDWRA